MIDRQWRGVGGRCDGHLIRDRRYCDCSKSETQVERMFRMWKKEMFQL